MIKYEQVYARTNVRKGKGSTAWGLAPYGAHLVNLEIFKFFARIRFFLFFVFV